MGDVRPGEGYDDEAMRDEMERQVRESLAGGVTSKQGPAVAATAPPEAAAAAAGADAAPAKPPAVTWEEGLRQAGITQDQAHAILTSMLTHGYYERDFPIYGGAIRVRLRTRDSYCRQRVSDAIDETRSLDPAVQQQTRLRLLLAGSLVAIGKDALEHATAADGLGRQRELFDARLARVDRIPDAMLDAFYVALMHFDRVVYASLANGAPSGF